VHEISPSKSLKKSRTSASKYNHNLVDLEQPLIEPQGNVLSTTSASDFVDVAAGEDKSDLLTNKVFYGTMLKGMRKFMVVRSPYCIHNKTQFTYEVQISDSATKDIKYTAKLSRGELLGLDDDFMVGHQLNLR
jgi:hypothetical protein